MMLIQKQDCHIFKYPLLDSLKLDSEFRTACSLSPRTATGLPGTDLAKLATGSLWFQRYFEKIEGMYFNASGF